MIKKDENYMDQNVACRRLIAAVVARSIEDACRGAKNVYLTSDASSALSFLFVHSKEYLSILEIDAEGFRKRLLSYMAKKNSVNPTPFHVSDVDRRNFLINFRKWNAYEHNYREEYREKETA